MTTHTSPPASRAAFAFIFITVALDMLALGVVVPVLPKLIKDFQHGNVAQAAEISGWFGAVWALMQFVCSPVLGALSDRYGRRPLILLSNLGLGLDYVLMALSPNLTFLFVGRVISGITAASFSTAGAYVADVTPVEQRAARFGMLGAAFGLGFVIGPAAGGLLGSIDLRLPFWVAGGLSLANALYGFLVLPESLPKEKRAHFQWSKANPIGSLTLLRSHPELLGLAAAGLLSSLAHESLPSIFVLYTDHRYGWGEAEVGVALASIGVFSTIVSALLVGPIVRQLGERRTLLFGSLCGAAGFATYGFAERSSVFLIGIPLVALWGLATPAMQALMTKRVSASEQGQLQGALGSLRSTTGMIGPLLFTNIFSAALTLPAFRGLSGIPYLLAASMLVCALLVALWATRERPEALPSARSD